MMDPMLMRLNQVLFQERLEAAALARRRATRATARNLLSQLRNAIGARVGQPALPRTPAPRKLHS
jgi:hypothetical protein